MERTTFLIVTPALNGAIFLGDCIDSVKSAFGKFPFKHIIVDGGSTDNTHKIVERYKHDNLIFLVRKDSSMYQAINVGLSYIKADYFYQLNVDDIVLPQTPQLVYKHFKEHPKTIVVTGACLSIDIKKQTCKFIVPTKNHFITSKIGTNLFVSQPSTFVRYDAISDIGGFNEHFKSSSDTDLWLRLIQKNYSFYNTKICLSVDRVHDNCRRLLPAAEDELATIRANYYKSPFSFLLRIRNKIVYLYVLLVVMVRPQKILQNGIITFGSMIYRVLGLFFSTKRAGIELSYPFITGKYTFEGRLK